MQLPKLPMEQLPRFNAVEQFEKQRAKEQLAWFLRPLVDHRADEVLADPVRCPVGVGELVGRQYRIARPGRRQAMNTPPEDTLPLSRKTPEGGEEQRRLERAQEGEVG